MSFTLLGVSRAVSSAATIAFDASSDGGSATGVTSWSWAHTCSGSNRILWIAVLATFNGDNVTSVTYNGVAATRAAILNLTTSTYRGYLYYLVAPATGSHNVTVNCTNANNIFGRAASYTGASQTGVPDASTTKLVSASSISTPLTTVADACWTIASVHPTSTPNNCSAGTGTTLRGTFSASAFAAIVDSNGAISPAGSTSLNVNSSSSQEIGMIMASFKGV